MSEARAHLDAADRASALAAIDAALAIDPDFLAAQLLRERVVAEAIPPSEEAPSPPPLVSNENYARFEQRAKRRRVDRRLDAARSALARGRVREANAALEEISELDPHLPELAALREELSGRRDARSGAHLGRSLAAAAAFAAILLGASWLRESGRLMARPIRVSARLVTPPETSAILPADSTAVPASEPLTTDLPETAPVFVPTSGEIARAVEDIRPPTIPPPAPPPVSAATSATAPPPPSPPVERREPVAPPVAPPSANDTAMPAVVAANAPAPAPVVPPVNNTPPPSPQPAVVPAVSSNRPPARAASAPSGPAVVPAVAAVLPAANDELLVQQTLQHYRRAYDGLDARSARAVWPAVNEAALARAFDGLQSQALTFDACDVKLQGQSAAAICHGSARYVPKVGSHEPRVEPRTWNFRLKKNGPDWQIESARADR